MNLPAADVLRAAILGVVNAVVPMLVLFGIADWSADQVASVMLAVSTVLTLAFLFYPSPGPGGGA